MSEDKLLDKKQDFHTISFISRISKQGDAFIIRIPKSIRDAYHFEPRTIVHVTLKKIGGGGNE